MPSLSAIGRAAYRAEASPTTGVPPVAGLWVGRSVAEGQQLFFESLPFPPLQVSSPPPPRSASSPKPPNRPSPAPPPLTRSSPPPAFRVSVPPPPLSTSA